VVKDERETFMMCSNCYHYYNCGCSQKMSNQTRMIIQLMKSSDLTGHCQLILHAAICRWFLRTAW